MEGGLCADTIEFSYSICEASANKPQSECEADCTSSTSCIAYEFGTVWKHCVLYPTSGNCPSNYKFYQGHRFVASLSDLRGITDQHFSSISCYGKINGRNIKS